MLNQNWFLGGRVFLYSEKEYTFEYNKHLAVQLCLEDQAISPANKEIDTGSKAFCFIWR